MNFFKKEYVLRRYGEQKIIKGYASMPYEDRLYKMDIQTTDDIIVTSTDGREAIKSIKVFCDFDVLVEDKEKQQKADRVYYQGKWFECQSSRLSENTPLKHYTATFIQLPDGEDMPDLLKGTKYESKYSKRAHI